jgi:hypothetical protein
MSLSDFLFGKKGEMQQVPTMTGGQSDLLNQLLGGLTGGGFGGGTTGAGMEGLFKLLSGDTEAFEAPLMRQFQESTIPGIAERFSGLGAGAQGSSAFSQGLSSAGAGLSEQLGSMRGGLQQQGLSQLMNMMNMGLGTKSFENVYKPPTQGFMQGMSGGIGSFLGNKLFGGF